MPLLRSLLRADLRHRWRSLALLALLVAFVVATTLTALAGARRTEGAFDRYLEEVQGFDALAMSDADPLDPAAAAEVDGVQAAVGFHWYAAFPGDIDTEFFPLIVPDDPRVPETYLRAPVVSGRRPAPDEPLEVALGERTARRLGVTVGDPLPLTTFTSDGFEPSEPDGPRVTLEVVGILRNPGDVVSRENDLDLNLLTPAFAVAFDDQLGLFGTGVLLDVEPGVSAEEVGRNLEPLGSFEFDTFLSAGSLRDQADPTLASMADGLRILALVTACVGGTVVVLGLARAASDSLRDHPVLRALGVDGGTLFLRLSLPSALATGLGLLAGLGLSVLVSPLAVTGLARRAEVDPGVSVDGPVTAVGGLVIAVLLTASIAVVGLVTLHRERFSAGDPGQPSSIATRAAGLGAPVAAVTGLRLAFERGRGRRATPVTAAAVASALGGLGVMTTVVFGSSLQHAVTTPAVYGWGADGVLSDESPDLLSTHSLAGLEADPAFTDLSEIVINLEVTADGAPARATVLDDRRGHTAFVMAAGVEPVGPDQVAVGGETLEDLGKEIGDTVRLSAGGAAREMEIVGVAVLPVPDDGGSSSSGYALRGDAADAIGFTGTCDADVACSRHLAVHAAPGLDLTGALEPHLSDERASDELAFHPASPPSEVDRLTAVESLPRTLAGVLGVLAVIAIVHTSSVTVRRRRRDLAVLRALGLSSRGLRGAVTVQVAALALTGGVAGVVLGVALGRQLWIAVAETTYLPAVISFPAASVILVPLAIALLAHLGAALSRRAAGRVPAALALRAE
jgi:hypothetical protein